MGPGAAQAGAVRTPPKSWKARGGRAGRAGQRLRCPSPGCGSCGVGCLRVRAADGAPDRVVGRPARARCPVPGCEAWGGAFGPFRWWWQVVDSNHRRRSRRFTYRCPQRHDLREPARHGRFTHVFGARRLFVPLHARLQVPFPATSRTFSVRRGASYHAPLLTAAGWPHVPPGSRRCAGRRRGSRRRDTG